MTVRPPIFQHLLAEGSSDVEDALILALDGADASTTLAIIETLITRARPGGLQGLVSRFHLFDETARATVLAEIDALFRVLRECSQSRHEQVRINVVQLIAQGRAHRAAYLLEAALHDRAAPVRVAGAEALHELADQILSQSPSGADLDAASLSRDSLAAWAHSVEEHAENRRQVVAAIEAGVVSFHVHLHPKIFEASMWYVDDIGPRFWAMAGEPGSRASRVAFGVLHRLSGPRLVPFCYGGVCHGALRQHVAKMLSTCEETAFWLEWMQQGWRAAQPRQAKGLLTVKELSLLASSAAALTAMPSTARRHAPQLVCSLGVPLDVKLVTLRELYRNADVAFRRSIVAHLGTIEDERAYAMLRSIARDEEPTIAGVARYELARRFPRQYPPSDLLAALKKAPVAASPARPEPDADFEAYWSAFDRLTPEKRAALGSEIFARNHVARSMLLHHLESPDPGARVRAVSIIAAAGMADRFTDELYRLSHDPQPDVRSAVVAALGGVANPTSKLIVRGALTDPDARVQANAVEAVEKSGQPSEVADLQTMLASSDNRVRANAIKALLKLGVREAAETLLHMLQDESRAHRISALWLVEQMGLFTIGERILSMASTDHDAAVRERARQLIDRLPGNAAPACVKQAELTPVPAEVPG